MSASVLDLVVLHEKTLARHGDRIDRLEKSTASLAAELTSLQGKALSELSTLASRISKIDTNLSLVVREYEERAVYRALTEKLLKRVTTTIQLFLGIAAVLGVVWAVFHFAVVQASPAARPVTFEVSR